MRSVPRPSPALVVAVVALAAALGGFAVAAVPDRQGRITVCYAKKGGDLRVLATGTKCRRSEKRLRFNQTGPTGPAGAPGTAGGTGPQGLTGPQGSPAASMLTGNTGNVPAPSAGLTAYLHPSGVSDWWGEHNFADMLSPNATVVAQDLAVSLPNPPGVANEFYKITFQLNQADTALTCTITGTVETSCGNSDARVTIPAGSLISLEVEVSGAAVSRRVRFGWRATTP